MNDEWIIAPYAGSGLVIRPGVIMLDAIQSTIGKCWIGCPTPQKPGSIFSKQVDHRYEEWAQGLNEDKSSTLYFRILTQANLRELDDFVTAIQRLPKCPNRYLLNGSLHWYEAISD